MRLAVDVALLPGSCLWRQSILCCLQQERQAVLQHHPLSPGAARHPAEPATQLSTSSSPWSSKAPLCPLQSGSLRASPGARLQGALC